ncbi:MAG: 1-deoxy-D-xylulose-5-phosphate reductoisomerase [Ignavibacteriales bacterium]|nr:1-deoxy-D-xylulose-5-phosphate reductoisomerase [Ignavibacteriales bacterium]
MKKIAILGSTGSIGVNTLNVIRKFPKLFDVEVLCTNTNIELLEKQIEEFEPRYAVVNNQELSEILKKKINKNICVLSKQDGMLEAVRNADYDILIAAMVGFSGLLPTIESIKRSKKIGLANKETLVSAGELVIELARKYKSEIIPIDSEHSAIFQCLVGEKNESIEKIILTASGGPFLNTPIEELSNVTVDEALKHPKWAMGSKITIDSATMMNKGLEVIEAYHLFNLPLNKIDIVIHPESVIHSMVKFNDGSIKAQLSIPDMRIPIQYALTYPDRLPNDFIQTDFAEIGSLTFLEADRNKFGCLQLAYNALQEGGLKPCILNAANEVAVNKFLKKEIKFTQIIHLINEAMNKINNSSASDLEQILQCDCKTREFVNNIKI